MLSEDVESKTTALDALDMDQSLVPPGPYQVLDRYFMGLLLFAMIVRGGLPRGLLLFAVSAIRWLIFTDFMSTFNHQYTSIGEAFTTIDISSTLQHHMGYQGCGLARGSSSSSWGRFSCPRFRTREAADQTDEYRHLPSHARQVVPSVYKGGRMARSASSLSLSMSSLMHDEQPFLPLPQQPPQPKCYLVLSNLQSGSNIGSICRNALAFNVSEVIVVGQRGFRDKMRQADRGAKMRLNFVHFQTLPEAIAYLNPPPVDKLTQPNPAPNPTLSGVIDSEGVDTNAERSAVASTSHDRPRCLIYGVEIMPDAIPITKLPFDRTCSTAFIFGNEGGGLSQKQRDVCDHFVYIPQYADGGMASINVACASAIILQVRSKHIDSVMYQDDCLVQL
jgi:tRNA(Leu) C34 or U34 (ribose-2'-O)-methylase TrmL